MFYSAAFLLVVGDVFVVIAFFVVNMVIVDCVNEVYITTI